MPQDPFQGRASSEGPPFDHALTVTRADGDTLPVIPSAFYLPGVLGEPDANGDRTIYSDGGQNPYRTYLLCLEMLNGTEIEIRTAGANTQTSMTIYNALRIRKILWDRCPNVQAVTLLW